MCRKYVFRSVVQHMDQTSTGTGGKVLGATTGSIANACSDATGVRLRKYPMMPNRGQGALSRQWVRPSGAQKGFDLFNQFLRDLLREKVSSRKRLAIYFPGPVPPRL
jgi:hypothetical protein